MLGHYKKKRNDDNDFPEFSMVKRLSIDCSDKSLLSAGPIRVTLGYNHLYFDKTSKRRFVGDLISRFKLFVVKYHSVKRQSLLRVAFDRLRFTFIRNYSVDETGYLFSKENAKIYSSKKCRNHRQSFIRRGSSILYVLLWHRAQDLLRRYLLEWKAAIKSNNSKLRKYFDSWNCWVSRTILLRLNAKRFSELLHYTGLKYLKSIKLSGFRRWKIFLSQQTFLIQLRLIFKSWKLAIKEQKEARSKSLQRCLIQWKQSCLSSQESFDVRFSLKVAVVLY